jgi:hypothetical protein
VTRVPVEILTSILKYACIGRADLRAVAGTCRYLRAVSPPPDESVDGQDELELMSTPLSSVLGQVACPLLFHEMSFVLEKLASLDVLQAMKHQPEKAGIVE